MPVPGGLLAKLEKNQDLGRPSFFHFDTPRGGCGTQQDLLCPQDEMGRAPIARHETKVWTGAPPFLKKV